VEQLLAHEELPSMLIGRARRIRRADIDAYIQRRLEAEKDITAIHVQPLAPDAPFRLDAHRHRATRVHSAGVKVAGASTRRRPIAKKEVRAGAAARAVRRSG